MATIDQFFEGARFATVDIDPGESYGRTVYDKLSGHAREVAVVLREPTAAAQGAVRTIYPSVAEVPGTLDAVVLNVENDPPRALAETQAAIEKGARRIWIENRCNAAEAVEYARAHGAQVVDNACVLLALEPEHIHWVHRKVVDVFHKTPPVLQPAGAVP